MTDVSVERGALDLPIAMSRRRYVVRGYRAGKSARIRAAHALWAEGPVHVCELLLFKRNGAAGRRGQLAAVSETRSQGSPTNKGSPTTREAAPT